jgi:alkylation response protein AidB-like acyl-CoA dehydrogenase
MHHADALDLARDLATQFATRADEADRQGKLPAEDVQALKESGYLAMNVPREYGGPDLSLRTCVEAQLELAKGSSSTALVAAMQIQVMGGARRNRLWPEALYERLCRAAVTGDMLCNSLASEPEIGSPSRGRFFATTAVKSDDKYTVNGRKTWSTGGAHLTHMIVGVSLDEEPTSILIEGNRDGVEWVETWTDALSLRAADNHDVYFRDVEVPLENLAVRSDAAPQPFQIWGPMLFATVYLGTGLAARDAVVRYALERVPKALGKSISHLPKIQRQIGEVDMALMAARALMLEVADDENSPLARVAAAKQYAVETANSVTDQCIRIAGAAGISRALPLERYLRDARAGHMHPPNSDTAYEAIGQGAIGSLTD